MAALGEKRVITINTNIPHLNQKVYTRLVEINVETGLPTGRVKINSVNDPDYIPPIQL